MSRKVDTCYGPMPGCPDCGVIVVSGGPHLCEHGVTPAMTSEATFTTTVDDPDAYARLVDRFHRRQDREGESKA